MAWWQWIGGAAAVLFISIVFAALRRLPDSRLSRPLLGVAIAALLWTLGDVVAGLRPDMLWKQVGIALLYTGSIFLPPMWWMLTLRWATERGAVLGFDPERWSRWPLVWASAMWLVMITNPWHGRFLTPVIGGRNVYGALWWAMALPNYALVLGASAVALQVYQRSHARTLRRQAALVCSAGLVMLLANWLYVFRTEPSINATLVAITASAAVIVVGLYREGLFGLLPVALPVVAANDPDGLVLVRPGGRLAWANPRAHALLAPVRLLEGVRIPDALLGLLLEVDGTSPDEADDRLQEVWWRQVLEPSGQLYRFGLDGERWLRMRGHPIRGRGGQVMSLCLRIHDATEEERLETELRRARRLESVAGLARGVAHDFRNLLLVAQGNAELLAADLGGDPRLLKRVDRILQAAGHAAELADQLQLYAGGGAALRLPLDLAKLVAETAALSELEGKRIEIAPAHEPMWISADATQLRQAVGCLCLNALEALPEEGGEVHVQMGLAWVDPAATEGLVLGHDQPRGEYAWVRVSDTGGGIDAETQERIFEPFYSTKGKRRGIGLSTVLGVVRNHDALLQLATRSDCGSSFTLYLRLEPPEA
jgi:signal transduction histidine kinase